MNDMNKLLKRDLILSCRGLVFFLISHSIVLDKIRHDNLINNDDFSEELISGERSCLQDFRYLIAEPENTLKGGCCYNDPHFTGEEMDTV